VESNVTRLITPNIVGVCLCVAIATPIFTLDLYGYTLAETLMNYQFGFYRRALLGNFFILAGSAREVTLLTKVAYTCCFCAPLIIVVRFCKMLPAHYCTGLLLVVFFSPFGILNYLKNFNSFRKELFFYPLFLVFLLIRPSTSLARLLVSTAFVFICCLVHESFFFLFLPFFLAYLYLNKILSIKHMAILAGLSAMLLVGLSIWVKGNSKEITTQFVDQFTALGFDRAEFEYFYYFQKFSFRENLDIAIKHFTIGIVLIYNVFYLLQFPFFLWLGRRFGIYFTFKNPKGLLLALTLIWAAIFALCFIAMDYGRWFSMGFVTSVFLVITQTESVAVSRLRKLVLADYLLLFTLFVLSLVVYIPYWTYETTFNPETWTWNQIRELYQLIHQFAMRGYHHFFSY
jgi:hypothetical protein